MKSQMLIKLNHWLLERYRAGERAVLVVDEAQNLSSQMLEEIRLLTNMETSSEKLLQIVLSGQPELEAKLNQPQLRQLRQRVTLWAKTRPVTLEETRGYIDERLRIAGNEGTEIFSPEAIEAVYRYARGIPRVTNLLCMHSLVGAFVEQRKPVPAEIVEEAARDFGLQEIDPTTRSLPPELPANGTDTQPPENPAGGATPTSMPAPQAVDTTPAVPPAEASPDADPLSNVGSTSTIPTTQSAAPNVAVASASVDAPDQFPVRAAIAGPETNPSPQMVPLQIPENGKDLHLSKYLDGAKGAARVRALQAVAIAPADATPQPRPTPVPLPATRLSAVPAHAVKPTSSNGAAGQGMRLEVLGKGIRLELAQPAVNQKSMAPGRPQTLAKHDSLGSRKALWIGLTAALLAFLTVGASMLGRKRQFETPVPSPANATQSLAAEPAVATSPDEPAAPGLVEDAVPTPSTNSYSEKPTPDAVVVKPVVAPPPPARRTILDVGKLPVPIHKPSAAATPIEPSAVPAGQANTLADNVLDGLVDVTRNSAPAPPPPANSLPPAGGQLQAAELISLPAPPYPPVARVQGVQGVVVIDALVDATGRVTQMNVVSGPELLRQAALDALRTSRFRPARLNGQPIATATLVSIKFNLR